MAGASYAARHVSDQTDTDRQAGLPRCPCGHDRNHFMVSPENHYSFVGRVILMLGISVEPVKVTYQCRKCWKIFDESSDPRVMQKSC
jgi:hypothetical protein